MPLLHINQHPSRRDLLWFGGLLVAFLVGLGAWAKWRWQAETFALGLWLAAAAVGTAYFALPAFRRPCYLGFSYATAPIGWVVSLVMMLLVYYVVLTPIGIMLRLMGHDPMTRKWDRSSSSYWVARPEKPRDSRYFRQY